MFLNLINLFKKNENGIRMPLEDFNTECFAGILSFYPNILDEFCYSFLGLKEDHYQIKTQFHQSIRGASNCIIDLVLIGTNNICFIENKVESSEGDSQLERYIKALNENHKSKRKSLIYCTKYSEPKDSINKQCEENELGPIDFNQRRWYQVSRFLKPFEKDTPVVKSYLEFLTYYKMTQDNTIKSENLISMENMRKTIEILEFHIDNCKSEFIQIFEYNNLNKNFNWDQIKIQGRVCYYNEGILISETKKYSEVLYSIDFEVLKLVTQIYIDKSHELFIEFTELTVEEGMVKQEFDSGFAIRLEQDIGYYLNNNNSDKLIKDWFIESFQKFHSLIKKNNQLKWNIKDGQ